MLFTSYGFIAFLAVLFVLYYLIPKRFQWLLLLAADIVFYACAGWKGLCFMAATVVVSWAATNLMGASLAKQKSFLKSDEGKALERAERKAYKKQCEKRRKVIFVLALVADLGILAALKYTNFLITNVNALFSADIAAVDWVLPLGISFYTFQTVSYVIDVYWEKVEPEKNILRVALFTSFFPLLIQGPISRFGDLKDTLFAEHKADFKQISFGLQRILWGYFKKLVIADRLLVAVTALCGDPSTYTGRVCFHRRRFVCSRALCRLHRRHRHNHRCCAGAWNKGEGELHPSVFFAQYRRILAQMAHFHGHMVQGLYFLSAVGRAVAPEALKVRAQKNIRRLREESCRCMFRQ